MPFVITLAQIICYATIIITGWRQL